MRTYFNYRILIDYTVALSVSVLICLWPSWESALFCWPEIETYRALMVHVSASAASLLGFVIAAATFLVSYKGGESLEFIRKSKAYAQLLSIIKSSIWRLFVLAAFSGLCIIIMPEYHRAALIVLSFLGMLNLSGLAALIWSTTAIISLPSD